jgi:hypothetical protein
MNGIDQGGGAESLGTMGRNISRAPMRGVVLEKNMPLNRERITHRANAIPFPKNRQFGQFFDIDDAFVGNLCLFQTQTLL